MSEMGGRDRHDGDIGASVLSLTPAERIARARCMDHVNLALAALENVEWFLGRDQDGPLDVSRAGDGLSAATAYLAQAHPHLLRAMACSMKGLEAGDA